MAGSLILSSDQSLVFHGITTLLFIGILKWLKTSWNNKYLCDHILQNILKYFFSPFKMLWTFIKYFMNPFVDISFTYIY